MLYLVDGSQYMLSYQGLVADYYRFCSMPDDDFIASILDVMHFCCVVGYLKEIGPEATISDQGVIHELVHVAKGVNSRSLREIREQFSAVMKLA